FFGVENHDLSATSQVVGDFSSIVTSPAYNLIFKGLLFAFDLGVGLTIFGVIWFTTNDVRRSKLAFALWFLNPFVIYQSAVHGAADNLVGFSVISVAVFILAGRPFWAGGAWVLGIMTKIVPLFLALQLAI